MTDASSRPLQATEHVSYWQTREGTEEIRRITEQVDRITFGVAEQAATEAPRRPRALAFSRILVATDGSPGSYQALEWAAALARAARGRVHVVTVVGPFGLYEYYRAPESGAGRDEEALAKASLEKAVGRLEAHRVPVEGHFLRGPPTREIVALARSEKAELVVVGSHGRGRVGRFFLGSTADGVKDHAPVSVLIARSPVPPSRILVPTDGSMLSKEAALLARDLARAWQAKINLLHVVQPPPFGPLEDARKAYRRAFHELDLEALREPGLTLDVQFGSPADRIVRTTRRLSCGLIVMGSRGLGGIQSLGTGSVGNRVVHRAPASVLLVKGPVD